MSERTASAKADDITAESKSGKAASKKGDSSVESALNLDELRELAELVNSHGFTDFEFENENIRVRLSKSAPVPAYLPPPVQPAYAAPAAASAPAVVPAAGETAPASEDDGLHKILSPIVGTFYRAAGPDKEPYVKEGAKVSAETVVCIVEAMKLMNEIPAEASGEIVKIYVENGQPVEYGQPLFGIKK